MLHPKPINPDKSETYFSSFNMDKSEMEPVVKIQAGNVAASQMDFSCVTGAVQHPEQVSLPQEVEPPELLTLRAPKAR